jgi:hypothetical protein
MMANQAAQREAEIELVRPGQLGQVLGTPQAQALKWTKREDFPAPVIWFQARPVWDRADLERWAKERTFG